MSTAEAFTRYACAILMSLSCCAAAFTIAFRVLSIWHQDLVDRDAARLLHARGRYMAKQAHWFATLEQRAMWAACADAMGESGYPDARHIRDVVLPSLLASNQAKF